MPSAGSTGSYGRLIVTPDMEPPDATDWDTQEQAYRAAAATWERNHEQINTDNKALYDAASSKGFDEGAHRSGAVLAVEAETIAEWYCKCANKCADIATVLRDTRAGQEQLIREADSKIAAAKLPGEAEALVAQYHGRARYLTEAGVTAAIANHTSFKKSSENVRALDLLTKWGEVPVSPPAQPLDDPSPGIEQGNDPWNTSHENGSDEKHPAAPPADKAGSSVTQSGVSPGVDAGTGRAGGIGDEGHAAGSPITQPGLAPAPRPAATSPLGGGAPSMGGLGSGGGGLGSGGGGLPKMPGGLGGGVPGMGSSSPLGSGLGQMPGSGTGLPSAGGVSASGAGSPVSAFSQGVSTGAGLGGGMPVAAPASPSPALTGGAHGGAAMPPAAAPGGGVAPASAQPGVVASAAALTGAGMGSGGGAPMVLQPGSMGPPAAAVPPPAPTIPAGAVSSTNAAAASAPGPPGAAAGPTLIPASVIAAGQTAAAQERRESADAAAARELVWKIQHAASLAGSPMTGWAGGVFRSPSGAEIVITSNDGAGYIPAGVFVPRSVRVLASDPLVDDDFRQLWFGWADPAQTLVEYAQLRAQWGWRLVAAASTLPTSALRDAGVEHPPACTRETNPLLQPGVQVPAPVLDDMHAHRLAVLWPEMYPRLLRIMDADPIFQERIVSAVTAALIRAATSQAQPVDIPDALRHIWEIRGGDREPTTQEWAKYNAEAQIFNGTTAMNRPAFVTGGTGHPRDYSEALATYRAHWLVARTAEHIGGWAARPLPLPDMCYGAVVSGGTELPDMIVRAVVSVEDDLRPANYEDRP